MELGCRIQVQGLVLGVRASLGIKAFDLENHARPRVPNSPK